MQMLGVLLGRCCVVLGCWHKCGKLMINGLGVTLENTWRQNDVVVLYDLHWWVLNGMLKALCSGWDGEEEKVSPLDFLVQESETMLCSRSIKSDSEEFLHFLSLLHHCCHQSWWDFLRVTEGNWRLLAFVLQDAQTGGNELNLLWLGDVLGFCQWFYKQWIHLLNQKAYNSARVAEIQLVNNWASVAWCMDSGGAVPSFCNGQYSVYVWGG